MNRFLRLAARLLFGVGVAAIVWLSLAPGPPAAPGGDKLHHFAAYFLVALCGYAGFGRPGARWVFAGMAVLGAALELAQGGLTATRVGDFADLAANVLGVSVALAPAWPLWRRY